MDFNALGVHDWAKLQGLAFMMLLSTLIYGTIQQKLSKSTLSGIYMPEVLMTAGSIKAIRNDGSWGIENASKRERELFSALEISIGTELKEAEF